MTIKWLNEAIKAHTRYLFKNNHDLPRQKKKRKGKENDIGFLEVDVRYAAQDIRQFRVIIIFV